MALKIGSYWPRLFIDDEDTGKYVRITLLAWADRTRILGYLRFEYIVDYDILDKTLIPGVVPKKYDVIRLSREVTGYSKLVDVESVEGKGNSLAVSADGLSIIPLRREMMLFVKVRALY
jgi:hypothetical protein